MDPLLEIKFLAIKRVQRSSKQPVASGSPEICLLGLH